MNPLLRRAARVYPQAWRKRYGGEFEALLEDSGGGLRVFVDVLRGGIAMRVRARDFRNLALAGLVGMAVAVGISLRISNQYTSSTVLMVSSDRLTGGPLAEMFRNNWATVASRSSLMGVIMEPELLLYNDARTKLPIEDVIRGMKKDLEVKMMPGKGPGNSLVVKLSYVGESPGKARATVQHLVTLLIQGTFRARVNANAPVSDGAVVQVLDPPSLPRAPKRPNRWIVAAAGLVAGSLLGVVLMAIARAWASLRANSASSS